MNGESEKDQRLQTRTLIVLDGEVMEGQPAVDKLEATGFDDKGLKEAVLIKLKYASGCGHVIHTAAEMGGLCANPRCHKILCAECSKSHLCYRCGKPVCGACRREQVIDGEKRMVCEHCYSWFPWEHWPPLLRWIGIGRAGLLLLRMILR